MIPILSLSETFFYFIVICIAGAVCVATLLELRRGSGRGAEAALTLILSAALIALILFLAYRDRLALPSDLRLNVALGLGLIGYFAAMVRRLTGDRLDSWAGWYLGIMIGFGLTLYLIAVFRPVYLAAFTFAASVPVLGLVTVTAPPLFFLTFEKRNGTLSRLILSGFATLALLGLYAIPALAG